MKSDLRFRFSWHGVSLSLCLLSTLPGCESKKKQPPTEAVEEERELLEPLEQTGNYSRRCKPQPGTQAVTLRASESGRMSGSVGAGAVEAGGAVAVDGGFVVGTLRTERETNAELLYLDGRGGSKVTLLGRVHGSVEPPQVAAVGGDAMVALVDNDAGHTRLRLAKVTKVATEGKVTWGPEVEVRRGETQSFSLNILPQNSENAPPRALLAWDDFDQASLRSSVRGLLVDVQSMKALGTPYEISPPKEDATTPQILAGAEGGGAFSVWLAYQDSTGERRPSEVLVDEPPKSLRVQRLDSEGKPQGKPLVVSRAASNVLVYDAKMATQDTLAVAYREADSGRDEGSSPVQLAVVSLDGSVRSHTASHDELGLGAPALFVSGKAGTLWLSARARESDVLLGSLGTSGEVEEFGLELELKERMPLAGHEGRLLVMEPDGLDLRFSAVFCGP